MPRQGVIEAGEGAVRARPEFLMSSHLLTYFEIQKHHQNTPKFIGVYSRNDSPRIKYGTYVINLDKHKSIGIHWISYM